MATQIKLRRDTALNWFNLNPTLALGEPGFESNTGKLKIGNGVSDWNTLEYLNDLPPDLTAYAGHVIPSADNTYDLGSPTKQWRHAYIANGSLYIGDIKVTNQAGQLVVQQVTDPGLITEAPVPDTPGSVTTNRLINGLNEVVLGADGKLTLPVGGDIVDSNGTSVLGGGSANLGNFGFSTNVAYNSNSPNEGLYIAPGGESTSYLYVPGNSESVSTLVQLANTSAGGVNILSGSTNWTFRNDGVLRNANSFTKTSQSNITTTAPTVVWTATEDFISGVKLQIQVESFENGDTTGWHSQVCEAIIASRGYANSFSGPGGDPVMTVYGVTHTSTVPLVTFTVQRNPTTKFIEVVGTFTAAVNPTSADLRIYSVETATRD